MINSLKDNFFKKLSLYGLVHKRTELIKQDKWNSRNFCQNNCLFLILVTLFLINQNWKKQVKVQQKNPYLEQSETLFERRKDNCKPNPLPQAMIHSPNLYYSKIYQKKNWKKNTQFPLEQEQMQPPRHLAQLFI